MADQLRAEPCPDDRDQSAFIGLLLLGLSCSFASCKKYLDEKQAQNQAVPASLADLQALMDRIPNWGSTPAYAEFVADNYYVSDASWAAERDALVRNSYLWKADAQPSISSWQAGYEVIYHCNVVLEYLPRIQVSQAEAATHDQIKGGALFSRAFYFHCFAQLYCNAYSSSASTDRGIILRTTSNINAPTERATVQQTYDRIIEDLKTAATLLPVTAAARTRPNKAAAYGLLARVYLSMRDYTNAGLYAGQALALNSDLLDFNNMAGVGTSSFPEFTSNKEIQYYCGEFFAPALMSDLHCNIDSTLYRSYDANDLRKTHYFRLNGTRRYWWGGYFPSSPFTPFNGIANDEQYLIRAECRARTNDKDGAMNDLNILLRNRWATGTFTDLTAATPAEALDIVLAERRKELLFRGLRWSDLRRFNLEGANITLKRIINGTTYTLPPNDLRWTLLIPSIEIMRSGVPQNPR